MSPTKHITEKIFPHYSKIVHKYPSKQKNILK